MPYMSTPPLPTRCFRERFESLCTLGLAVEFFPNYVNRTAQLHLLDVVYISLILRGGGLHYIDNETFEVNGSSLAITHYGQRQDIVTDHRGMDVINLYLDLQHHPLPVLPRELQQVLPLLLPPHPRFLHRLNRIVSLDFADPRPFAQLLFSIQRELKDREPAYEEAVRLQFKLFLMLCCRHAIKNGSIPSQAFGHSPQPRIEELRQYLDQSYAQPHTLKALADRAGMTRTSLCRAFKEHTSKRLFDYLIERRIQGAMASLHGTNDKVVSVAMDNGFPDIAHFNRKFKQLVGVTPTMYRDQSTAQWKAADSNCGKGQR